MYLTRRKYLVWLLVITLLLTQIIIASPLFAQDIGTDRISGADRYKTAVAVSQKGWKTSDYAVLARGDNFADALCAGPLAQKYGGPILLTQPNQLNSDTLKDLQRLGVKHLFIVGGVGAVSQSVENSLKANGIDTIERIFGNDRYETSVKIAEKIGNSSKVVLATGSDFPDALSISGIAAKLGMPILLTAKNSLPTTVGNYLQANTVTQTYVVGGTGVISSEVASSVPSPSRLAGNDRYETNKVIMQNFASELNFENIYVAVGSQFADALTGAVLAAKSSAPLVLTGKTLPADTANYLQTKLKLSTKVKGLGGKLAVPSSILTGIVAAKEQISVEEKYSTAGTYGPETGTKTIQGSVIISSADVTLRNTIIEGDLLLGSSIGDGDVELRDVTVRGKTIVNGGGPNSIIMYNFNGQTVVVEVPDGANVRLVAQGNTTVANVSMEGNGMLQEAALTGTGFINVAIPAGAQVTLSGDFQQVNVEGTGANVTVASGNITTLSIPENAVGARVNLASGSSVSTLNANAPANVTGQGQITNANITAGGVTIEQTPGNTTVSPGNTANVGGQQQTGTSTPPSSEGDSGPSSVSVSPITSADVLLRSGSIVMGYGFEGPGGLITYSQAISDTYGLDLATSTVTLAVQSGDTYNQVGNTVNLSSLTIENSADEGESAKVTFADFGVLLDTFNLDLSNPANIPTHVKVVVQSKTSIGGQSVTNPWGSIDSGWVLIDTNLVPAVNAENSSASVVLGNKTAGFAFPVSITIKDASDANFPDGTYAVEILNGPEPIGGGQIEFTDGQASVNALIASGGTYSLTVKVNNTIIEIIEGVTVVASPILEGIKISEDGGMISLTFSKDMANPINKNTQFTITVDGETNAVTAAGLNAENNKIIELTLTNELSGYITIAYTQGDVTSADSGYLCTFIHELSNTEVTSTVYTIQILGTPGDPDYLLPLNNRILGTESVPITTATTVGDLLSNLSMPTGSLFKVFASENNPFSGGSPVTAFHSNITKENGDFLTFFDGVDGNPDFLFVLAQDGVTLRGYRIHVSILVD